MSRFADELVATRLTAAGLGALMPQVLAAATDEIWIDTTTDAIAPATSRIGGEPHLPAGVPWPRHRWPQAEVAAWPEYARVEIDRAIAAGTVVVEGDLHGNLDRAQLALALPFVAQLDLAALAPFATAAPLPRTGHLWLFADQMTPVGELDGRYHSACACLYAAAPGDRATPAPTVPETWPGRALAFRAGRAFPDANELDLRGDDWARYEAVRRTLEHAAPHHGLFVRPYNEATGAMPPDGHVALLRVDSDDALELNWGDASWMTFAIARDDLAARRWSEVRAFRFDG